MLRLENKEIDFILSALDKVQMQGIETAGTLLTVASKLAAMKQENDMPPSPVGEVGEVDEEVRDMDK